MHTLRSLQYESSQSSASRPTEQMLSWRTLHAYKAVSLVFDTLCEVTAPDELLCSRKIAATKLRPWREWRALSLFQGPFGLQVWSGLTVVALSGFLRALLSTLPWFAFFLVPSSYATGNLLRHVDTPVTPFKTVAVLSAYTMTPVRHGYPNTRVRVAPEAMRPHSYLHAEQLIVFDELVGVVQHLMHALESVLAHSSGSSSLDDQEESDSSEGEGMGKVEDEGESTIQPQKGETHEHASEGESGQCAEEKEGVGSSGVPKRSAMRLARAEKAVVWVQDWLIQLQDAFWCKVGIASLWTSFILAQLRANWKEQQLRARGVRAEGLPERPRPTVGSGADAPSEHAPGEGDPTDQCATSSNDGEEVSAEDASGKGPCDGGSGEGTSEAEEPICRICFAGADAGRLVSPCLCSGSMRYVHLDCLSQWRKISANPLSAYQCENCLYRYSFRRTLYATVLRSALVLHLVTFLLLLLILFAGSHAAQFADTHWLGGSILEMSPFNIKELKDMKLELSVLAGSAEEGSLMTLMRWLGVDASYLLTSLVLIGATGFLTLGMMGPMLWHRGHQDTLLFVVPFPA